MKKTVKTRKKVAVISDYDSTDVSSCIDTSAPLKLADIGVKLPEAKPTEVVSIRLPRGLLNELRAIGSRSDVPYQALIKLILIDGVRDWKKKNAA
jgi:hypothetical protein